MATPLDRTIQQMQDTLIVMGEIQARQARVQKIQAEELDGLRERLDQEMKQHNLRMKDLDERIAKLVSGIGEFLRKN